MKRVAVVVCCLLFAGSLIAGCSSKSSGTPTGPTPEPTATSPGAAGGTRIANGLYDMPDGTVQAVGTLAYSDLEGGFWQITGAVGASEGASDTVAVIANGKDFESQLKPLEGQVVSVKGTRSEGASTRMAGPEITMTSVEALTDTGGPAE